jgi:hypothetical protein
MSVSPEWPTFCAGSFFQSDRFSLSLLNYTSMDKLTNHPESDLPHLIGPVIRLV